MTAFDVLILGSGLAGQSLALRLADSLKVALVTKRTLEDSASAWAQGGIAAVLDPTDSLEAHIADTHTAGAGLCSDKATRFVVENGPRAIRWLIDHGVQFTADAFRLWCLRHETRQRFGAIGKYGSIAVVERFIRSMKTECARAILVSFRRLEFDRNLAAYLAWFNAERPHTFLAGATPDEIYFRKMPACRKPRFEPREGWPRPSRCARPQALVRGRPGATIELVVEHRGGRKHLPIIALRRAA